MVTSRWRARRWIPSVANLKTRTLPSISAIQTGLAGFLPNCLIAVHPSLLGMGCPCTNETGGGSGSGSTASTTGTAIRYPTPAMLIMSALRGPPNAPLSFETAVVRDWGGVSPDSSE
jgi:hypothetical protein